MHIRLENFGAGGLNADIFETGVSPSQWSVLENVDIDAGDIVSAGADVPRNDTTNVEPLYIYLFNSGEVSWDVISDGNSVYANDGVDGWVKIGENLGGAPVTFSTFEGCLIVNSPSSGAYSWCPGREEYDTWFLGSDEPWADPGRDNLWLGSLAGADTWGDGSADDWTTGADIEWAWLPDDSSSVIAGGLALLPDWDTTWRARQVVPYGVQLVAIGAYETGTDTKDSLYQIRWSSLGSGGILPQEWEPAVGNFAGFARVGDTPGALVNGTLMRDDLILYKTDSIWRLSATGDPVLPMRLEKILTGAGVDSTYGVADTGQGHVFPTRRGISMFDGNQVQYIDFARVQNDVLREFSGREVADVVAQYYGRKQEVWIGYRERTAQTIEERPDIDLILKFNIQHSSFTRHRYTGKSLKAFSAGRERISDFGEDTWRDGSDKSWADGTDFDWTTSGVPQSGEAMILGFATRTVAGYKLDVKPLHADGSTKEALAIRYGLRLAPDRQSLFRYLYPEGEGEPFTLTVGVSWAPGQQGANTTKWELDRTYAPGQTRSIPLRVIGDTFALQVQADDLFRLHAIGVDYEPVARR